VIRGVTERQVGVERGLDWKGEAGVGKEVGGG
jgi:hypothetical protein